MRNINHLNSRKPENNYCHSSKMFVTYTQCYNTTDSTFKCASRSLLDQLKELQALVASTHPTKAQTGTCLMVLFLAFGLVLFPINNNFVEQKNSVATYAPAIGKLLFSTNYYCLW